MIFNSFEAPLKLVAGFCFSVSNVPPLVFLTWEMGTHSTPPGAPGPLLRKVWLPTTLPGQAGPGLVPSGISQGGSVPCSSPSCCWFLETLLFLDLWEHYSSLFLVLTWPSAIWSTHKTSATKCGSFFLKHFNSPHVRTWIQSNATQLASGLTGEGLSFNKASHISCQLAISRGVLMTLGFSSLLEWLTELREVISLLLPVFL